MVKCASEIVLVVQSQLRRAGGFAAVATLALAAPALGPAAAAPFAAVAVLAAFVVDDGWLFELFARPGDRRDGRLNGLAGFALAATALGVLTALRRDPMPVPVFAASVIVLAYGSLGREFVRSSTDDDFLAAGGFVATGFVAGTLAQIAVTAAGLATAAGLGTGAGVGPAAGATDVPGVPTFAFLAAAGALVAGVLRSVLFTRDDPLVIVTVGFILWVLWVITPDVSAGLVALGIGVTVFLGLVSFALRTANVTGMLTGVLLGLVTVVLGGIGWFLTLMTFFSVGALASKFRYDRKVARGVAEDNEGARGTGNVLGNAAVGLAAVVGFAAASTVLPDLQAPPLLTEPFGVSLARLLAFAFAGSLAAAMADTLSSEIGGLFDEPRLVTTLQRVEPGTDGAVTWQGELAGLTGAVVIGVLSGLVVDPVASAATVPVAAGVVAAGGVVGMTVDSLLGATVEGAFVGNETVNFLATVAGALVAATLLVPLS